MKGKLYRPQNAQSGLIRMKSVQEFRKSNSPVQYIWQSSIPDSWKKILEKRRIPMLQLSQTNKNTMEFLKHTQKYIDQICQPSDFEVKYRLPLTCASPQRLKLSRTQYNSPVPQGETFVMSEAVTQRHLETSASIKFPRRREVTLKLKSRARPKGKLIRLGTKAFSRERVKMDTNFVISSDTN